MKELKEKINLILNKRFKTLNNNFQEKMGPSEIAEWDSLEHLNLITELNKIFNINIEFEDVMNINTILDIYQVVEKYINEKQN